MRKTQKLQTVRQ